MRCFRKGLILVSLVVLLCGFCAGAFALSYQVRGGFVNDEDRFRVMDAEEFDLPVYAYFGDVTGATEKESVAFGSFEFYIGGEYITTTTEAYSEITVPFEQWKRLAEYNAEEDSWELNIEIQYTVVNLPSGYTDTSTVGDSIAWSPGKRWPVPAAEDESGMEESENINKYQDFLAQAVIGVKDFEKLDLEGARDFLNFLYGEEVCKVKREWLFWVVLRADDPTIQDFCDLLTGNTKDWSSEKIDRTKREFLFVAESLLSSRTTLNQTALKQRSERLMEYTFGVKNIHELTKDKTVEQAVGNGTDEIDPVDLVEGIAETLDIPSMEFNPSGALSLMDAEKWDAALNAAYTMLNMVEASDKGLVYGTWNNLRNKRDGQQDPNASLLNWGDQAILEAQYDYNTVNYKEYAQLLYDMEQSLKMYN